MVKHIEFLRNLLFNVEQPLELSIEEFDKEWWPLVSNIWTSFSHKNNVNGNLWEVFICRFNKPKKSSTRKEEISQEKRRVTKIRSANLCFAKIKVYRYASEQKVLIERFKDSPDHSHTLEESEKLKRSQTVQNLVMQEAIKNYRPPEIVNAVKEYATEKLDLGESVKELRRKEVTNIKYKLKNLEQHGWLTLIDSTHKTNSKEDSVTIAEGLKIVRRFARHWSPRYFLSDQSNIESNSIRMAFPGLKNGEQDCDVTSTNALESYHSELKSLTSPQHGLIGACHKIVELDKKKCSDSEHVAYEFRVKRISAVGVDDDILQEIHKFPFPV
uniref:FAR1 domain-containing protein n=1 Tax=Rhizophagus irregularis (strain DAOM 181602 / DAOM 197198 / MUCL 43194) TaxID=747089 RepID=U9T134_RHIID